MSPQTMVSKIHHINDFVKFTRLTSLTKVTNQQIYAWIDEQKSRGNSGRTINNRLAQLKVMLRWVVMSTETRSKLDIWLKQEKIKDFLWPNLLQEFHISQHEARLAMRKAFRQAGFDNFCPHDLRHSYATDLKNLGLPTRKIQMAMGHSTEAITERYLSDLDGIDIEEIYQIKYSAQQG